jgi:hypothetical protein
MDRVVSPEGLTGDSNKKPHARVKLSRVMTWQFARAPRALRLLHTTSPVPQWLVLVPSNLMRTDIDEAITGESSDIFRYKTPTGDFVYMGDSGRNHAGRHIRDASTAGSGASMHTQG